MKNLTLLLATFLTVITPAFAEESVTSNIKHALKHSVNNSYFSVVITLGVVILLIYITGIIYAKLNVLGYKAAKKQYKDIEDATIIVRSTTSLGNNKSLHVIELSGKKMLIGVTNENISLLKDFDKSSPKNEVQEMLANKELTSVLPLDKIYPSGASVQEEDIKIENNLPDDQSESEGGSQSEEYGLYKKYL